MSTWDIEHHHVFRSVLSNKEGGGGNIWNCSLSEEKKL